MIFRVNYRTGVWLKLSANPVPEKLYSFFVNPIERLRKCFTFYRKDLAGNILNRVVVIEFNTLLQNYRPIIVKFISKMNGTATYRTTPLLDSSMNDISIKTVAAEHRDQRWMNIDHVALKVFRRIVQFEIAGQTDNIDFIIF